MYSILRPLGHVGQKRMTHQCLWTFSAFWIELEHTVEELKEQGISVQFSEAEVARELLKYFLNIVLTAEAKVYQFEYFVGFAGRASQEARVQPRAPRLVADLPRYSRLIRHVYREPNDKLQYHDAQAPNVNGPRKQFLSHINFRF